MHQIHFVIKTRATVHPSVNPISLSYFLYIFHFVYLCLTFCLSARWNHCRCGVREFTELCFAALFEFTACVPIRTGSARPHLDVTRAGRAQGKLLKGHFHNRLFAQYQ